MGLVATDNQLTVTPDQSLLEGTDTVYPVFIDPHVVTAGRNDWTMVQKEFPNTSFYNWNNNTYVDGYGEGVGFQNSTGVSTKRLIWEFDVSGVQDDSTIVNTSFSAVEAHSWSCTKAAVNLDRVGLIGPNTNWANQPSKINSTALASSNVQVRNGNTVGGDCKSTPTPITFSSAALASAVKNSLAADAIALRLSATETDPVGWKRFHYNATLSVEKNRPPNEPVSTSFTRVQTGKTCGDFLPASTTGMPGLAAKIHDPDGDTMNYTFRVDRLLSTGLWSQQGSSTLGPNVTGSTVELVMPAAWARNSTNTAWVDTKYRFTAQGKDIPYATTGPESVSCGFFLDSVDPKVAVSATVDDHTLPPKPLDPEEWLRRGQTLTFVFDPTGSLGHDGIVDVDSYLVTSDIPTLNNLTVDPAALGAPGTLPIETSNFTGEHWITVQSMDRAGRLSPAKTLNFRIFGAVQTSQYLFNEAGGSQVSATLGSDPSPPFALTPTGVSFLDQHHAQVANGVPADTVLQFDGVSGEATTTSRVVDNTHAFSVSAWVRTPSVTTRRVLVSQHNAIGQTFSLAVEPGCGAGNGCATFTVKDTTSASTYTVKSTVAVQPNHWYVLAGSFDDLSATHRIRVWVGDANAKTAASLDVPATFVPTAATGAAFGRDIRNSTTTRWLGNIEDVRFYTDEIAPVDVQAHIGDDDPNQFWEL